MPTRLVLLLPSPFTFSVNSSPILGVRQFPNLTVSCNPCNSIPPDATVHFPLSPCSSLPPLARCRSSSILSSLPPSPLPIPDTSHHSNPIPSHPAPLRSAPLRSAPLSQARFQTLHFPATEILQGQRIQGQRMNDDQAATSAPSTRTCNDMLEPEDGDYSSWIWNSIAPV